MLIVVSFVATLVVIYSVGYMGEEGDRRRRYFTEISLFVGVMLGLVLASSFSLLFIFWELVGLCSYLLIGFWFERPSAASAAKKAFLVTRVGDVMFMIGLFILFNLFGTLNYVEMFDPEVLTEVDQSLLTWGCFFMFGGAIGKSAQFPLHDWLPDAMEGPTTVSALIHAATMVKAGVYLVARMFPLLVHSYEWLPLFIAVIGVVTALMAATMALNSPNIKRVLAYSTISQLGLMFLGLGTGAYLFAVGIYEEGSLGYSAAMFHLMNHAFFKALLFLSAGAVIHYRPYGGDVQDGRAAQVHAHHIDSDVAGRDIDRRHTATERLLVQGRAVGRGGERRLRELGVLPALCDGRLCGLHDRLLHVPHVVQDLHRSRGGGHQACRGPPGP